MKQQMKQYISLLLALLLCVGLFALPVSAEGTEGECGEKLTWSLENGVLTISGKGAMTNYSERNYAPWYENRNQIQRIVIEKGVTTIGNMAFYQCVNLKVAVVPESVTVFGELAFAECKAMTQISMGSAESIGWACFYECESLCNVVLPESLRAIGDRAFYGCSSLGGITIPAGVEKFGNCVFCYCDKLVYVKILAPIEILPYWTFYGCDLLWEVYLPDTVQTVEDRAFAECPELYYVDYAGDEMVKEEIERQLEDKPPVVESPGTNTEVSYSETEGAVITTTTTTPTMDATPEDEEKAGTTIDATITQESGWASVAEAVKEAVNSGQSPTVNIQVQGTMNIPNSALAVLTDKAVTVNVHTTDNTEWKVILKDQTSDTLQGKQDLSFEMRRFDSDEFADILCGAESYVVSLGSTTLNSTILIPLGSQAARKVATLYAVSGRKLNKLSSVIVDYDGKAAFCLAGTSAGDYILALDVPNIDSQEVLVPEKLAPEFDITYGATLTDSQGNQYILTGRVNNLGFGLGTLTWIVVGVLVGSVILVGVIMVIWNKQQKKMYRQRRKSK